MFKVSDEYKEEIKKQNRVTRLTGKITTKNGEIIPISDENILHGSFYVNNQCVNGSEFEYGAVYAAEMGVTLKTDIVDRYKLYNAKVEPVFSLWVRESWEHVPLGVYYIAEPAWSGKLISIKALDRMTDLDVAVEEETYGTPWELLNQIADKIGFELAQTQEEIAALTNGDKLFTFIPDRIDTYRDCLACIAIMLCSFAEFDEYGKLRLVQYGTEPAVQLTGRQRTTSKFSDFETYYKGIDARFIADENYYPYEVEREGYDDGLRLNIGDIPIVQGLPEDKYEILNNMLTVLSSVQYVPCEISTIGDPAIRLGDMVENEVDGEIIRSLVTKYNWTYRAKHTLSSAGGNPKLAQAKSKTDKQFHDSESSINQKTIAVTTFTNAGAVDFGSDDEKQILLMNYATVSEAHPLFFATVQVNLDRDGIVEFRYYKDMLEIENTVIRKYLTRGEHYLPLFMYLSNEKDDRSKLVVTARTEYVESDSRRQNANIATQENKIVAIMNYLNNQTTPDPEPESPTEEVAGRAITWQDVPIDTTPPQAHIPENGIHAAIFAQGLAQGKWDGSFDFVDSLELLDLSTAVINIAEITDDIDVKQQIPTPITGKEVIPVMEIPTIGIVGLTELVEREVTE